MNDKTTTVTLRPRVNNVHHQSSIILFSFRYRKLSWLLKNNSRELEKRRMRFAGMHVNILLYTILYSYKTLFMHLRNVQQQRTREKEEENHSLHQQLCQLQEQVHEYT